MTFDLQARAERATHCLTQLLDPQRDGLMYFLGEWRARPPRADHCLWDYGDGSGRHIDALTLIRGMAPDGSPAAAPGSGDHQLAGWLVRMLRDDGLSWLPAGLAAEPWGKEALMVDWQPGGESVEISWAQRGSLMGLVSHYQRTGDAATLEHARRLVDGLLRIAVPVEHGLIFPEGYYRPEGWHFTQPNLHPGIEENNSAVVLPAVRMYEATGYAPALELAAGLVDATLYYTPGYLPSGSLRTTEGIMENHFHTRSNFILGVLRLGLVLKRREYISWARQSYEHVRSWGTDFGWFPEGFGMRHGEVCCTTDMIELALTLGRHVDPVFYADAERFGRNHLLESQFIDVDRLRAGVERLPPLTSPRPVDPELSTVDGVLEKNLGGFAARSTLNDAFHLDATAMMQCCNAAGARALYDLWHHAVEETDATDGVRYRINLRFSVATPTVRVVSHEPATGRVDVTVNAAGDVALRLPEGVAQALVVVPDANATGAQVATHTATDGYVRFGAAPGAPVEVYYALPERTATYVVGNGERKLICSGSWRGETLMRIDPPGEYYPLYQRAADAAPVQPSLPAHPAIPPL